MDIAQQKDRITTVAAVPACVNSDWLSRWGTPKFDPPQTGRTLANCQKNFTGDYVGNHYSSAKFGTNSSMGVSGRMGEI